MGGMESRMGLLGSLIVAGVLGFQLGMKRLVLGIESLMELDVIRLLNGVEAQLRWIKIPVKLHVIDDLPAVKLGMLLWIDGAGCAIVKALMLLLLPSMQPIMVPIGLRMKLRMGHFLGCVERPMGGMKCGVGKILRSVTKGMLCLLLGMESNVKGILRWSRP